MNVIEYTAGKRVTTSWTKHDCYISRSATLMNSGKINTVKIARAYIIGPSSIPSKLLPHYCDISFILL